MKERDRRKNKVKTIREMASKKRDSDRKSGRERTE